MLPFGGWTEHLLNTVSHTQRSVTGQVIDVWFEPSRPQATAQIGLIPASVWWIVAGVSSIVFVLNVLVCYILFRSRTASMVLGAAAFVTQVFD